jgi:hypothetical protein
MRLQFETVICSRCYGSGKYSYCEAYGDTCFKCRGSGKALSKRGLKAKEFMNDLLTIGVSVLNAGDKVVISGYAGTVVSIGVSDSKYKSGDEWLNYTSVVLNRGNREVTLSVFPYSTATLRIITKEQIKKVMDFQDSLTKQGKTKKRRIR